MTNNDIFRRLRYAFNLSDTEMISIFKTTNTDIHKDQLIQWLKKEDDEGYEGAIVLEPKCDIYLNDPVACVDYSSLYPSSMISENLSHDSKVWTKEYDLDGNLLKEKTGTLIAYPFFLGLKSKSVTFFTPNITLEA